MTDLGYLYYAEPGTLPERVEMWVPLGLARCAYEWTAYGLYRPDRRPRVSAMHRAYRRKSGRWRTA